MDMKLFLYLFHYGKVALRELGKSKGSMEILYLGFLEFPFFFQCIQAISRKCLVPVEKQGESLLFFSILDSSILQRQFYEIGLRCFTDLMLGNELEEYLYPLFLHLFEIVGDLVEIESAIECFSHRPLIQYRKAV